METATQTTPTNTESAGRFIKKVRRYTRRKYTAEDKIRIIVEGMKREVSTAELCRKEGLHPNVYYSWVKDFMADGSRKYVLFLGAGVSRDAGIPTGYEILIETLRRIRRIEEKNDRIYTMNILFVSESHGWSGGANQMILTAGELIRRGHKITFAIPSDGVIAERARKAGFEVIDLRIRQDYDIPSALKLKAIARKTGAQLVHVGTVCFRGKQSRPKTRGNVGLRKRRALLPGRRYYPARRGLYVRGQQPYPVFKRQV